MLEEVEKAKKRFSLYRLLRPLGRAEVKLYPIKTSALKMGVGGKHHAPAALPPGKTRYPLYTSHLNVTIVT